MGRKPYCLFVLVSVMTGTAFADTDQVGTLAQVEGDVKVFSHPGKTVTGPAPHAFFEGEYFSVAGGKSGDRVEKGNIVRTAPDAKVRILYDNGDQLTVSGGSAYRVTWNKQGDKTTTNVNLMYGKIRAMVAKGGPRSNLTVKTRSATMGVRGTDFFIADGGSGPNKGTEISVLRGEVAVKSDVPKAKEIPVKASFSAEIPGSAPTTETVIAVRQTTQDELKAIEKSSVVKQAISDEVKKDDALAKKIAALEKKAVEATMTDIKKEDPKLFAALSQKNITSAMDIQSQQVAQNVKQAPATPRNHKPSRAELENLESGVYNQYFKSVD